MHKVLVNRLGGLSLPRKSVVRLTDRPDMTLDVYRERKTTIQQQQHVSTNTKKKKEKKKRVIVKAMKNCLINLNINILRHTNQIVMYV